MILYLLILLILTIRIDCQTLFRFDGDVKAEDYRYYKIYHPGNLLLVVESLEGDADIYVSETVPSPNYHPDNYDFQSSTCGTDSVYLSKNVKRPFHVAIYGHFSHNSTRYELEVIQMPETVSYFINDRGEDEIKIEISQNHQGNVISDQSNVKKGRSSEKRRNRNFPNSLWPFLELFEILFL